MSFFANMRMPACVAAFALAWSAAAWADEGLTLYGLVDDSIASTHFGGSNAKPGTTHIGPLTGGWTDSLWGLKGEERLSGGWKTRFNLESGIDAATGRSSEEANRLFDYGAWVGLENEDYGAARIGRQSTVAREFGGQLEVASWRDMGMGALFRPSDNFRRDRVVNLYTPEVGGFQFGLGYGFGNQIVEYATARSWSMGLKYSNGPWLGVLTWDRTQRAIGDTNGGTPSAVQAGVSYSDEGYQFSLAWARQRNGFVQQDIGGDGGPAAFMYGSYADTWLVGAALPVSASGSILIQQSYARPAWREDDGRRAHPVSLTTVGYRHVLSPRTSLYAFIGRQTRGSFDNPFDNDTGGATRVAVGLTHSF